MALDFNSSPYARVDKRGARIGVMQRE